MIWRLNSSRPGLLSMPVVPVLAVSSLWYKALLRLEFILQLDCLDCIPVYDMVMATDSTIAKRMRRYRNKKRRQGFVRREVYLSAKEGRAFTVKKQLAQLVDGGGALRRAVVTVNVPRPQPIDAPTLLQVLIDPQQEQWRPHVEAFFTEVGPETIHEIVLGGIVDFPLLAASQKLWNLEQGPYADWIHEMARERLAKAA